MNSEEIKETCTEDKYKDLTEKELIERCNTARYILNTSYAQLNRYDGKTSQILTLIGFDFTIMGVFSSWLFGIDLALWSKIFFISCIFADLMLIIITLCIVRGVLQPHVKNASKKKLGLLFFMDIEKGFNEDQYVDILMGNIGVPNSQHYDSSDPMNYYKCIIEDCARDIYAQSKILKLKAKYVKKAYVVAIITTIFTFSTIFIMSLMQFVG
ncbi:MAG: hypothetical protein K2O35_06365 [Clostridia bacterium]|nr:hypothetical protein [Clostridia bacterium]